MPDADQKVILNDGQERDDTFLKDVIAGLSGVRKSLPSKYFYDERGSRLFDRICELDAYYPTRSELAIMERYAGDIAAALGPRALLLEYGSGSSIKTRLLLDALIDPVGYVPIDISCEHLLAAARAIANDYPNLTVLPVCADYTRPFDVPALEGEVRRRIVYFPGSTVGNFVLEKARRFLRHVHQTAEYLLIGVDLRKEVSTLEAAYNDPEGITAAFNLNLLHRIKRELDAKVDPSFFSHRAFFNEDLSRIEMHLVADRRQEI
ncbi:MAG: L-histidine N(alpha)-methyltransferase, partial [Rhodothermales bacterium]